MLKDKTFLIFVVELFKIKIFNLNVLKSVFIIFWNQKIKLKKKMSGVDWNVYIIIFIFFNFTCLSRISISYPRDLRSYFFSFFKIRPAQYILAIVATWFSIKADLKPATFLNLLSNTQIWNNIRYSLVD